MRIGVAFVALGLIVAGAVLLFGRGSGPTATPNPSTSPPAPPHVAFVFPLTATSAATTGRGNRAATEDAAGKIQATLSAFYDAAFADPRTWQQGLPPAAWNAFAKGVQDQAKADAGSLTLGEAGSNIDSLSVTDSSLSVRILLDPRGRPRAAIATVAFDASGTLSGGEPVAVSNRASFILRPAQGGRWLVVGYPRARTEVQTPSPTPSPSASATAGQSPAPGASP